MFGILCACRMIFYSRIQKPESPVVTEISTVRFGSLAVLVHYNTPAAAFGPKTDATARKNSCNPAGLSAEYGDLE